MIAKIVQGRGFKGVVNYVLDKNKAELLGADGLRLNGRNSIVQSFITQSSLNSIAKPVAHISLDFSAQDREKLTNRNHQSRSRSLHQLIQTALVREDCLTTC